MDNSRRIAAARARYRPAKLGILLVAEAPPADPERFFYFERVPTRDALFLETMRAVYTDALSAPARTLREHKEQLLRAFQRDGFYLLDAHETALPPKVSATQKLRMLAGSLPRLRAQIGALAIGSTPVVLIASTVYSATASALRTEGFNLAQDGPIDFPASGHALKFRERFQLALRRVGWSPKASGVLPRYADGREIAAPRPLPSATQLNEQARVFWSDPTNSAAAAVRDVEWARKRTQSKHRAKGGALRAQGQRGRTLQRDRRIHDAATKDGLKPKQIAADNGLTASQVRRILSKPRP